MQLAWGRILPISKSNRICYPRRTVSIKNKFHFRISNDICHLSTLVRLLSRWLDRGRIVELLDKRHNRISNLINIGTFSLHTWMPRATTERFCTIRDERDQPRGAINVKKNRVKEVHTLISWMEHTLISWMKLGPRSVDRILFHSKFWYGASFQRCIEMSNTNRRGEYQKRNESDILHDWQFALPYSSD